MGILAKKDFEGVMRGQNAAGEDQPNPISAENVLLTIFCLPQPIEECQPLIKNNFNLTDKDFFK